MKKFRNLAAFSVIAFMIAFGSNIFANELTQDTELADADVYESGYIQNMFDSISGVVTSIEEIEGEANASIIQLDTEEHGTVAFRTNYFTYTLGNKVEIGNNIRGYFIKEAFMTLQYPREHTVQLIVNGEYENVHIDRFYYNEEIGELVSADNFLRLNINETTQVLLQDGKEFEVFGDSLLHDLDGRLLVVVYDVSTRSIPALTTPSKIIVLFERAVHPIQDISDEDISAIQSLPQDKQPHDLNYIEWVNHGISVNDQIIENITWVAINDTFYVPFRVVVDALGYGGSIVWDGEDASIRVYNGKKYINFVIGSSTFDVGGNIINLEAPAIILENSTFVPLQFFNEVFGLNNSYLFEGQVFIDNFEPMQ